MFHPRRWLPLIIVFQGHISNWSSITAALFMIGYIIWTKGLRYILFSQLVTRNSERSHKRRSGDVSREDITGIWATCLFIFLILPLPGWTWSLMHHLHRMIDGFCACSALWCGRSEYTESKLSSQSAWSFDVVWTFSIYIGPSSSKLESISHKEMKKCHMQKRARRCFKALRSSQCPVVSFQKFHRTSLFAKDSLHTNGTAVQKVCDTIAFITDWTS